VLGLPLVSRFVDAYDGERSFDESPFGGTAATVLLDRPGSRRRAIRTAVRRPVASCALEPERAGATDRPVSGRGRWEPSYHAIEAVFVHRVGDETGAPLAVFEVTVGASTAPDGYRRTFLA